MTGRRIWTACHTRTTRYVADPPMAAIFAARSAGPGLRISAEYCSDRPQLVFRKAVPCAVLRVVPLGNHVPVALPKPRSECIPAGYIEPRGVPSKTRFGNGRRNVRIYARAPLNADAAIGRCFLVHHPEQLKEFFLPGGTRAGGSPDRSANGTHDEWQRWPNVQLRVADDPKPCRDGRHIPEPITPARDAALTARAMIPFRSALAALLAHQLQRPRNVSASVL